MQYLPLSIYPLVHVTPKTVDVTMVFLGREKPKPHPDSRNTKKEAARLHELIRKVRADFCLLSCGMSQEPSRNCSEKPVQTNFFILGGFGGQIFLLLRMGGVLPLVSISVRRAFCSMPLL